MAGIRFLKRGNLPPAAMAVAAGIGIPAVLPLLVLAGAFFSPRPDIWQHLTETILGDVLWNTVTLAVVVCGGCGFLGVLLAFLVEGCRFPGQKILRGLLLLPLAMPTYVTAFVYNGIFSVSGPVQSFFRSLAPEVYGKGFDFRSLWGVSLVLVLTLYPYVYLLCAAAFRTQGNRLMEAARTLGESRLQSGFRVVLPLARPWIAAGVLLVLMETIADFGAVAVFNFDTFTTAIYKAWFGLFSLEAAAQLSFVLVIAVILVVVLEGRMRSRMRFFRTGAEEEIPHLLPLSGGRAVLASAVCWGVFVLGFALPVATLVYWSLLSHGEAVYGGYATYVGNTLLLAVFGTGFTLSGAVVLAVLKRQYPSLTPLVRLATLGYAIPGTVLAVGMVLVAGGVDAGVGLLSGNQTLVVQGSAALLVAGYGIRFLAAGFQAVTSAFERISPRLGEAAALLGAGRLRRFFAVDFPLIRSGIVTGALLVFVEIMKEMPATLMLRPFGWDTLAVKVFELTSEGEWERAALPAMGIVLAGVLPVMLLMRGRKK